MSMYIHDAKHMYSNEVDSMAHALQNQLNEHVEWCRKAAFIFQHEPAGIELAKRWIECRHASANQSSTDVHDNE